ncbi:hypothetical protein G7Z17_g2257 [Cylindrodendrum hubeiense]|uniref:Uncharacterized protein n=1 Tax=Cylindrodendrum hubeiense TaxID=595255 RepID=A0A9P5LEP3_9HYPO|nr:hypothetical protein G7Z17_g2257 [Cylindrodendrum hubeiense]
MPATIHLVRHAQGFHNLSRENEAIHDPRLTELGEQQCQNLRAQFPHHKQVKRLFASPLRRTLQTCLLAFGHQETEDTLQQPPVIAIPEFQEVADSPCDTGSDPATLKQEFASLVDLHRVYDGWNSTSEWPSWSAKSESLQVRATKARQVLREMLQFAGDDDHVVVVTHGAFLHYLTNDYYGVEPARDPDGRDPEASLIETESSWEKRYGKTPRPTQDDQDKLQANFGSFIMTSPPALQRLAGKIAIVTGSSSGLGRAISLAYSREGASLVCVDLKPEARAEVASECEINTDELVRQNGGRAIFIQADLSKSDAVEAMVKQAVAEYGRIDILVNNAGISIEARHAPLRIHETPDETWDVTMAVNARSIFLTSKHTLQQMIRQDAFPSGDRGWIINMSSIFGLVGGYNNCSYAAAKAAVSNLTRQVALDYAPEGIHCNAICPGYTQTAIFRNTVDFLDDAEGIRARHPLHGVGVPEDIVGAAIFLASAEARWITGVSLPVDGGYTAQ